MHIKVSILLPGISSLLTCISLSPCLPLLRMCLFLTTPVSYLTSFATSLSSSLPQLLTDWSCHNCLPSSLKSFCLCFFLFSLLLGFSLSLPYFSCLILSVLLYLSLQEPACRFLYLALSFFVSASRSPSAFVSIFFWNRQFSLLQIRSKNVYKACLFHTFISRWTNSVWGWRQDLEGGEFREKKEAWTGHLKHSAVNKGLFRPNLHSTHTH